MLRFKKLTYTIAAAIMAALITILYLAGGGVGVTYAAASADLDYDNTEVMSDLNGMTIGGNAFNADDYPANAEGTPVILSFVEYCYSYYYDDRDNYALYVYIYNPAQLQVEVSEKNSITFSCGNANAWEWYSMNLLSASSDRLFLKFRVVLTGSELETIFGRLDSDSRVYDISEVELFTGGSNAVAFSMERKYTYTGYAKGYGMDDTAESTLSCTVEGGTETVELAAHSTTWRPDGAKPGTDGTVQNSITSLYFAVPKAFDMKYDYLEAVKLQWLHARTIPILITGNSEIYNAVDTLNRDNSTLLREDISDPDDWLYVTKPSAPDSFDVSMFPYVIGNLVGSMDTNVGYEVYYFRLFFEGNYNFESDATPDQVSSYKLFPSSIYSPFSAEELTALYWYMYYDGTVDEDMQISSSGMLESLQNLADNGYWRNDKAVADKYPSYLFESYDTEYTRETIHVGESYTLESAEVSYSWWESLFGSGYVDSDIEEFSNIRAIQRVDSLTGNAQTDCAAYYVGEADYEEFYNFFNANKTSCNIYLVRFATSDYVSVTANQYRWESETGTLFVPHAGLTEIDSNAAFVQTDVYLDTQIIQLEYSLNGETVVVPVAMSPIDVIPGATGPVEIINEGFSWDDLWRILGIVIVVVLIFLFAPVLIQIIPVLLKAVVWIISLPFRLIAKLFKKKE